MTTFERRQRLVEHLRKQPGLRVPELALILDVSQGTIRNDLNALDDAGQVTRVRGGAAVSGELQLQSPSFAARYRKNEDAKQFIARYAADLVEDGDSIFLDASTTVFHITQFLQNRRKLRAITNGIEAARAMVQNPTNNVILLGGMMNPDGSSISGRMSEQLLQDLHIQKAFMSCSGFTPDDGLTEVHIEEAQLKSKAISAARQVIALVDSSKFGKVDLTPFAHVEQISHLITDQNLSAEWISRLQQSCLTYTLCGEKQVFTFTPSDQENRHYRIGFANLSESLPFAVEVRKSLERAAEQSGNIDLVLADNQLDAETALKVAENFLRQQLDLVIEYQIDEQMGNRIMPLLQSQALPVIAVDIPIVGATYFGVDNYRSGHLAGLALGEWVREHWNGQFDHLVILSEPRAGALPATRIQGQIEGFETFLGPVPDEKKIILNTGNKREIGAARMIEAMRELPASCRLVVISFNDEVALGALDAGRKLERERNMIIVGQGAESRLLEELRRSDSRIIGSTTFSPEKYGEKLIALASKILHGESVPPAVYMEHTFIKSIFEAEIA